MQFSSRVRVRRAMRGVRIAPFLLGWLVILSPVLPGQSLLELPGARSGLHEPTLFSHLLSCLPVRSLCAQTSPPSTTGTRVAVTKRPAFSRERLLKLLGANRPEVRAQALADAEAFHSQEPGLPDALWQAIQHDLETRRLDETLFNMIVLHGRVAGPQSLKQQVSLLASADPRIAMLAADSLGARKKKDALQPLLALAERPEFRTSYGFRHATVTAVSQIEDRASIDFLIARLAATDGQLKYLMARQLTRLTGQNYGSQSDQWQNWWKQNRSTFEFAAEPEATSPLPGQAPAAAALPVPWDYPVPVYFGAPIYAKRVVFVIDQSRSMLSSVDGITTMELAQREFEAAVQMLPEDALFDVVAYESAVHVWQRRLVPATPRMRAAAIRFVNYLEPVRQTASYDALATAMLGYADAEAILFLSDGEPTAGAIVDRAQILQAITIMNRFRRIAIDVIGIDARNESDLFLKFLATANFGQYHLVR